MVNRERDLESGPDKKVWRISSDNPFTRSEGRLIEYVANGGDIGQVYEDLGIRPNTARVHLANVRNKIEDLIGYCPTHNRWLLTLVENDLLVREATRPQILRLAS